MNYQNPFESDMKIAAIQTYNIPLTVVLFTLFMRQHQPDTHILIDIVLGIVIALVIFAAYGFSVINTLLCLTYSGIWTYLSYLFFDKNIAWFHSIYATNGKYVIFAICFISFLLLHIKCADSALECFPAFPDIPHFLHKWNTFRKDFFKQKKEMSLKALTDENQKLRTEIDRLKEENKKLSEENETLKSNGATTERNKRESEHIVSIQEENTNVKKKSKFFSYNKRIRINLNVPYNENDEAKGLGAKWDPSTKTWYYKDNEEQKEFVKFVKWLLKPKKKIDNTKNLYVYDSLGEHLLDGILNNILQNHQLHCNYGIRILIQQPLFNYVQELSSKEYEYIVRNAVNNKNQWIKFDFLIEAQQGHTPLLVIELDGPGHRGNDAKAKKQQERDRYKDNACSVLDIPILRIPYNNSTEVNLDKITKKYENEILRRIFYSIIKEGITTADELRSKYPKQTQLIAEVECPHPQT